MIICNKCREIYSIKDNGVYSSLLCRCKIIIYYYEYGNHLEITKEERDERMRKNKNEKRY